MTRHAAPQFGVDRMVSTSWSGRRWSSPAARRGRALARGLEGRLPLQHHHVSDQNSSSSRCRASFSVALKHGIYRDRRCSGQECFPAHETFLSSPKNHLSEPLFSVPDVPSIGWLSAGGIEPIFAITFRSYSGKFATCEYTITPRRTNAITTTALPIVMI